MLPSSINATFTSYIVLQETGCKPVFQNYLPAWKTSGYDSMACALGSFDVEIYIICGREGEWMQWIQSLWCFASGPYLVGQSKTGQWLQTNRFLDTTEQQQCRESPQGCHTANVDRTNGDSRESSTMQVYLRPTTWLARHAIQEQDLGQILWTGW